MDNIEHERKYVVTDISLVRDLVNTDADQGAIVQSYLADRNGVTVRVRLTHEGGFLTAKGPRRGAMRREMEVALSQETAELLLLACDGVEIRKLRYPVVAEDTIWLVDVFLDDNYGLVVAEIEDPPTDLRLPEWCGADVTEDDRFYNASLNRLPFGQWSDRSDWLLDWGV